MASKRLGCTRCLQVFVIKWHVRSSSKKKQNSHFSPCFFPSHFFLHKPLQCPNTTKICTQLADPSLFDAKKIHIFWIFLLFFWIYCSQAYIFTVFPLTRAPGMPKQHEKLHAPCEPEYLWSHKFSDFLELFCYFFQDGQCPLTSFDLLWPDGNDTEGHFCKCA